MKIKEGFILRKCGNTEIVVPVGENVEKFKNVMITLSGSSKTLWDMLSEECTKKELVDKMLEKYDVERDVVENDVEIFIKKLSKVGILDE